MICLPPHLTSHALLCWADGRNPLARPTDRGSHAAGRSKRFATQRARRLRVLGLLMREWHHKKEPLATGGSLSLAVAVVAWMSLRCGLQGSLNSLSIGQAPPSTTDSKSNADQPDRILTTTLAAVAVLPRP